MNRFFVLLTALLFHLQSICQSSFADTAAAWFEELKFATRQHKSLWNLDLYAPLLLVNPDTREVFANFADTAGILMQNENIYTGYLPANVNISNTSLEWAGLHWAMIMLPLSTNKNDRIHLLTHELFHRAQKELGFFQYNPGNSHLDKKEGRIYLRLELDALRKAILSPSRVELKKHIEHALFFRKERQAIYPGADSSENQLELNEGIAEFTGFMISARESYAARKYFTNRIAAFTGSGSYIRSFAYETIPVYGFLLNPDKKGWNKEIRQNTNLTEFFIMAFGVEPGNRRKGQISSFAKDYNYELILAEETAREEQFIQQFAKYRSIFIDSPHVEIPLFRMNMSFDYTRQFSMDTLGMVYPSVRITDDWGILEAEQGVLVNPAWSQVNLGIPGTIETNKITGTGWTLQLNEGFVFEKDERTGNYRVRKTGD